MRAASTWAALGGAPPQWGSAASMGAGERRLNGGVIIAGDALGSANVGGAVGGAIVAPACEADNLVEASCMEAKVVDVREAVHGGVAPEAFLSWLTHGAIKPVGELQVLAGGGVRIPASGVAGGDSIPVPCCQDISVMADGVGCNFIK